MDGRGLSQPQVMKGIIVASCFLFSSLVSLAQQTDSIPFSQPVLLDETVIKAVKNGWDLKKFIHKVTADTTFYKAFRSLHLQSYQAANTIQIFDEKNQVIASSYSHTQQERKGNCRSMKTLDEKTSGHFYTSNHHYQYFTVELFDHLFLMPPNTQICNENNIVAGALTEKGTGAKEKAKAQLKMLMFSPGSKITGVPFMGEKACLFDEPVASKYDFKLSIKLLDGVECYLFQAFPKEENKSEVVYNEFSTWFRKSDDVILARNYNLSFHTLVYDFDVMMKVKMTEENGMLLPKTLYYKGNWHVLTKGRERAEFSAEFEY